MKIYPNNSSIVITKEVNLSTDIPLCYVDTNSSEYNVNTIVNKNFNIKEKKEILPYDTINTPLFCLFDKNGEQIDPEIINKNFITLNDSYQYVPYNSKNFVPKTFQYSVIAKKHMNYSSNMLYNLKVLIGNNPILANQFISICGDAPSRLVAPANVLVNNGDLSIKSLTNNLLQDSDFYIVSLKNLDTILEYNEVTKNFEEYEYDIDYLLDMYNTNIINVVQEDCAEKDWIEVDEEGNEAEEIEYINYSNRVKLMYSKEPINFKMNKPNIYNNVEYTTNYYFSYPSNSNTIIYHNLFDNNSKSPILIEEQVGKGFKIYLTKNLIEKAIKNNKIIYEALIYVYFRAYLKTDIMEEWITDIIPDYIVSNKKLIKKDKFISTMELHKMFGVNEDEIEPYKIEIDKDLYPFVNFTGMDKKYLTFEKNIEGDNKKYADPIKPDNCISIYTKKQNILFFDDFIYSINDSIEDCINIELTDNNVIVNLKPFRHSSSGINVKFTPDPLYIPLTKIINNNEEKIENADYYLICNNNDSASYFEIVESTEYTENMGNILVTIEIRQINNGKLVYDMRQRGGGLPESEKDNYNCFDIGHIYGRPYRKANSLIITLPKYLENYKDIIMSTIKQHCVAEDYPILIFKED